MYLIVTKTFCVYVCVYVCVSVTRYYWSGHSSSKSVQFHFWHTWARSPYIKALRNRTAYTWLMVLPGLTNAPMHPGGRKHTFRRTVQVYRDALKSSNNKHEKREILYTDTKVIKLERCDFHATLNFTVTFSCQHMWHHGYTTTKVQSCQCSWA